VKREQLEHVLRAASTIAGDPDVLVIGSQSILGSVTEETLPWEATASIPAAGTAWNHTTVWSPSWWSDERRICGSPKRSYGRNWSM
jgi:hypothetical protein